MVVVVIVVIVVVLVVVVVVVVVEFLTHGSETSANHFSRQVMPAGLGFRNASISMQES